MVNIFHDTSSCKSGQTIVKRCQTIVKRSSKAGGDRIRWGNCGVGHTAETLQRIAMLALRRICRKTHQAVYQGLLNRLPRVLKSGIQRLLVLAITSFLKPKQKPLDSRSGPYGNDGKGPRSSLNYCLIHRRLEFPANSPRCEASKFSSDKCREFSAA